MEGVRASTGKKGGEASPVAAGLQKPHKPTRTHGHIETGRASLGRRGGEAPPVAADYRNHRNHRNPQPHGTWREAGQAQDR